MNYSEKREAIEDLESAMKQGNPLALEGTLSLLRADKEEKRALIAEAYTGVTSGNVDRTKDLSELVIKSLTGATASSVTSTAQAISEFLASLKK